MHVRRLTSLVVALVLILASVPAGADAQAGAAWTFMVYMAGDNDLEPYALLDMAEIEAVGSTGRVNVLVQFDRAEGYDNSQGGWTETRRYYALRDSNANSIGSQLVESMGELNMGDEGTLADFLVWGITTYPAERYAVVIWDHGAGWPGVAFDEAAGDDGLTIPEIARALEQAATQTGIGALDVIAFDACLMAQIEVFQALAPFGDVGVASPELVPGMGYDYASVLQALASNPDMDAQALGRVMVDTFMYFYQNVDVSNPAFSLSAVDLSAVDAVASALGALGTAVQINPSAVLSHIGDARTNALAYTTAYLDRETVDYYAAVDLGDLMGRLARVTNISQVASAAEEVADAVAGMVIHEGHSTTLVGASGVSIYFPRTRVQYEVNGAEYEVAGAADARWLNFLGLYYGTVESVVVEAPQLFITSLLQDQVSIHEPTQVSLDLTGRDIAHVDFVVNYELGDGRYVILDRDNIVTWEEVNGEMVAVNSWENGLNSIIFPWNGETPVVTDGQTETYALLVPREGLEVAVGEGRYIAADSEKWVEATLVFDIDSREVRSVYGISTASGSAPFEIKPRPGDRFQLYWKFVNDDGSVTNEPGETLTFGDAPFRYEYVPAPDGTYRMGFVAENIAGVSSYRWIDLQVRNEALDRTVRGFTDWDFGFNFLYPEGWHEPSWDSVDEVLWTTAEDADIRLTIYPLEGARSAIEAAAALQDRWSVDLTITEKRQIPIDQGTAMVVRYTYESQKGPRGGIYATFYHPALDMGFGFDLDAAPEDLEAAFAGMDVMLSSLRLFDPGRVTAVSEWTVDVNQALGYALPVRSEWLPARLDEGGWFVYTPQTGSAQTFVAMRADRSRGIDNEALAERWLSALYDLEARQAITVTDRREYYIGNESWFAIDFSYTWAANNTPMTGAFFVTTRGDVNYVYWIEAPTDEYELAYANTFSVMIDGFEFLSGAQPTLALPTTGGLLRQVYTAAGDSYRPERVTPTATFGIDDDINVVYVTNMDAEVTLVLTSSEGERVELDPQDAEAGVRMLNGLDWESYGEPWPVGQWTVEILVDGRPAQTLTITVEGETTGDVDTGPLSGVYTAAGDGVKPEELTATDVFTTDDDLNIVVTVSRAAEVTAVFKLPGDLSGEDGPVNLAAGESRVFGLDWESYGEPWPAGAGTVEVQVGGEVVETLTFTISAPGGGAPVEESAVSVYTAAGDELDPDLLTATTVFASDDDLNVVITAAGAVQVSAVFVTPTGERVDFDPEDLAAGHWQVYGLDWESFGQAWPAGKWLVEVYVNGALYETLAFRVEG